MHPALWQLLWFDIRGSVRGLQSVRKNWRQLVLFLLMLAFVGFFIAMRAMNPSDEGASRFGPAMPFWALIYLLATWLTASADRGLVMRPAEIHFIAGGPFRDRDVITINLIRLAFRAFISASVLSLLALAYVQSYLSALLGIWMLISVSLLCGMLASLASRKSQAPIVRRLRSLFTVLSIGILLTLIVQSMQIVRASGESPSVSLVAAAALETDVGKVVLPPLAWMFAPLNSAAFLPDTLALLPVRLLVLLMLVGAIYLLGGRYLETSTRRTDQSIEKRQTALRSGVAGNVSGRGWARRLALPMFPRLGGIGSVGWMQMIHSVRILPRFLVFTLAIVGIVLVIPIMVDPVRLNGWGAVGWMTGLTLYADFLLLLQLPVGFLGPVAQRELLKSLPIPSWRIVFGQLAGPVAPLLIIHVVVTALFLVMVENRLLVLQTAIALIPAALVLIANINLLGVWNIIRPRALQQRDALAAGRAMASVWIFFLMLTPAIVVAAIAYVITSAILPRIEVAPMFGASLGLLFSSGFYISLLARSFRNWQPSSAEGGKEETEHDR